MNSRFLYYLFRGYNRVFNKKNLIKIFFLFSLGFLFRFLFSSNYNIVEFSGFLLFLFHDPLGGCNKDIITTTIDYNKSYFNSSKMNCFGSNRNSIDVNGVYNLSNNTNVDSKKVGFIKSIKRRVDWTFVESRKDYYGTYENYKSYWNSDINLRKELKHKIWLQKEAIKWFISRRKPNN